MKRTQLKRKTPIRSKPKKGKAWSHEEHVEAYAKAFTERLTPERAALVAAHVQMHEANFTTHPATPQKKQLPGRSEAYKAFLRTKPCCVCGIEGRTEVAHQGRHGVSTKASDYDALPMCGTRADKVGCHQRSHDAGFDAVLKERGSRLYWFVHESRALHFIAHHRDRLKTEYLEKMSCA